VGTDVRAVATGTVKLVTKDPKQGGYIVLEHEAPTGVFTTTYAHVEPLKNKELNDKDQTTPREHKLKEGDIVQAGDVIGKVALGSEVLESHLRFQLREAAYSYPLSIKDRLPEGQECAGDPAFPASFYNPLFVKWLP
jgi:murein DD-endopeptidase MepM/ murein hydrolase activator NlpD